ncbi:hypothetical protein PoB_001167400 [Plakobranchus ocellatus]|uniref:Uncharacterized protein n=1 Tax=Plakobranchus ocellatus TaxID=259542 RepID=A0AAV3YQ66_9GAST|nr:hypothetical protein PoB_001167400 [Plakobranchus ocellatus]
MSNFTANKEFELPSGITEALKPEITFYERVMHTLLANPFHYLFEFKTYPLYSVNISFQFRTTSWRSLAPLRVLVAQWIPSPPYDLHRLFCRGFKPLHRGPGLIEGRKA